MLTAEIIPSVKVKHAKGSTDNSKIWFDYWVKHVKEDISAYKFWHCECCNLDVPINEMVGAHVVKADNSDDSKGITLFFIWEVVLINLPSCIVHLGDTISISEVGL